MIKYNTKLTKSASIITLGILISKILGFGREMSIAKTFGASVETDTYLLAAMIPMIIFSTVANSVTTTFIPVFTEILHNKDKKHAFIFANKMMNIIILWAAVLAVIGIGFANKIVPLIALGYKDETLALTTELTRIMLPILVLLGIAAILTAILQSFHRFFIPAISWVPHNIVIIAYSIFFGQKYGVQGLAYITVLAVAMQVLIQIPQVYRLGYRYRISLDFRNEYVHKVFKLIIPVLIGIGIAQINTLVDRMLATSLENGSIAALNFANKLFMLPLGVFVSAISTAIFPQLSQLSSENNLEGIKELMIRGIRIVTLLVMPMTVGLIVLRIPIIEVLFKRGAFDDRATHLTAIALFYYTFGMIGFGLRDILNRVYYALQDTRTPMINGAIAVILNIVLNLILVEYLAHGGLALATSISSIFTVIMLLHRLEKKVGDIQKANIVAFILKITWISGIMGIGVSFWIKTLDGYNNYLVLCSGIILGSLVYLIMLRFIKVEELNYLIDRVNHKLKRRELA